MNEANEANEIVIDNSNFKDFFFDVRRFKPKAGQIMAKFSAVAIFGAGPEKQDLIKVLKMGKPTQAAMVMQKIHCAKVPDCYRVCREICEDLSAGMSEEDVLNKEYEFVLEAFYYTQKEYVPKNDPHWETIQLINVEYDEATGTYRSQINLEA